jgi:hypothetical protein
VVGGCEWWSRESGPRPEIPIEGESAPRNLGPLPDALLVHFESSRGQGLSRESWEIEILQMREEIKVRGSVRNLEAVIPIYRNMSRFEYTELWNWLGRFPLDSLRIEPDPDAPEEDWRKTLQLDIVVDPETRIRSRNSWTRPLLGASWIQEVEDHLHLMTLDYAEEELERIRSEPPEGGETRDAIQDVLKELGDEDLSARSTSSDAD